MPNSMHLFNCFLSTIIHTRINHIGVHISYSQQRDATDNEDFEVALLYMKVLYVYDCFVGSAVQDLKIEETVFSSGV